MKKTVAAGSALAVGVLGVVAPLSATSAQAVDAQTCDFFSDVSWSADVDNWYESCVPQYGLGKVEFTISSDTDFPADFKDLTDPSVTVTSTADLDSINSFFASSPPLTSPFSSLTRIDDGSDPKVQRYRASDLENDEGAVFRIASVSEITPGNLPQECGPFTYDRAFEVTLQPLDVTFTQTVNGEKWEYHVVITPNPLFVGGTLASGNTGWDGGLPLCAVQGSFVSGGLTAGDSGWTTASYDTFWVNPYPSATGDYFVGDFPRVVTLPSTGVDITTPLAVAGGLLLAGLTVVAVRRRRA